MTVKELKLILGLYGDRDKIKVFLRPKASKYSIKDMDAIERFLLNNIDEITLSLGDRDNYPLEYKVGERR